MGYLKKYWKRYRLLFILCLCFLTVEALCDLYQPTLLSHVVDVGIKNKNMAAVLHIGGLMLLVTGIGAVGAVVRNNLSSRVSQYFGADLREDLYEKIQSLSCEAASRFDTASLVTRLTNDVTQVQNFANGMMRIFAKAPILFVGSIVMAVLLDAQASLLLLAVVPCVVALILFNTRKGYPLFAAVQGAVDRMNGRMRSYLGGVRVVKAFHRQADEERRFGAANDALCGAQAKAMRTMAFFSPSVMMVVNLGIAAVLCLGAWRVNVGLLGVGKVIAFVNYMTQLSNALMTISMVFMMFVRARASAGRIGEVMNVSGQMALPAILQLPGPETDVRFEHVCFRYHAASAPVLEDLSFFCKAGQTLGIIGPTGAGKSSLVHLIPRLYDAQSGSVTVCGRNVRQLDPAALRAAVAMVPQKSVLFSGTVLENLLWGDENATRAQAEEAARVAQAHDFIVGFPEGYDTRLGQGGVNLSGGQKQRLCIARALLRRPRILILDDCTSAVDAVTEQKIRAGLRACSREMLCVVIAQRISSVVDADQILVLENGRAAGLGRHDELMKTCPVYRDIFASQAGKAWD